MLQYFFYLNFSKRVEDSKIIRNTKRKRVGKHVLQLTPKPDVVQLFGIILQSTTLQFSKTHIVTDILSCLFVNKLFSKKHVYFHLIYSNKKIIRID